MKVVSITFLTGALLIGLFNLWIDPGHRWHHREVKITKDWDENYVLIVPNNYDERTYIISYLSKIISRDVLILGSSRAIQISQKMFTPGYSLFNASVSGASVQDYIAIWQFLKETHHLPKEVIIFADPWIFNRNNHQSRWRSYAELYQQFLSEQGLPYQKDPLRFLKKTYALFVEARDLLTWEVFKSAMMTFYKGTRKLDFTLVKEIELPPDFAARQSDGSLIYPRAKCTVPSTEEITQRALSYISNQCIYSLCDWQFDEKAYQDFKTLLGDIEKARIRPLIIFPPYQHVVYDKINNLPEYQNILPDIERKISRLKHDTQVNQFDFCNAINPNESDCQETEFMDGMHPFPSCLKKVLHHCALGTGFVGKLAAATMDL